MKNILFVCTGNVCRSPMATGLMRQHLQTLGLDGEVSVESAGVWALEGKPASSNAVTVMANRGIDIADHIAANLEAPAIRSADIILVMEEAQRRSIFYMTPQHLAKVFLLSEMSGQHHDIKDPFGQDLPAYERCADELQQLVIEGTSRILARIGVQG